MKTVKSALMATLLAAGVMQAHAEHKYEISAGAGYQNFDSDRFMEDDGLLGLGLGVVLNPRWTLEAWYTDISTEVESTSVDADVNEFRLDALYHFATKNGWTPFLVAGLGDNEFDVDGFGSADETRLNFGVGVKKALAEHWDLRGDVRAFNSLDEEDTDYGALLALTYKMGMKAAKQELDSDNDGVVDSKDSCPNTPAGAPVDNLGCALDSDLDGVYDYKDSCPNTERTLKVDSKGCPLTLEETVSIELEVLFDNNSDVVKPAYFAEIERVATFMNQYANTAVEIQGHTDDRGAAAYNEQLSQRRASAVAKVLVEQYSVDASRVSAKGYGEAKPKASNDSIEGRAQNRRVVAEISTQVSSKAQR